MEIIEKIFLRDEESDEVYTIIVTPEEAKRLQNGKFIYSFQN